MVHQLPQCTGKLSLPRSLPLFHSLSSSLCPSLSFSISLSVPIEPHLLLSSPHHVHSHDLADSLFLFLIWGLHFFKSCLSDVVRVSSSPLSLLALFTQMQIRQPYCTCPHWCRKVSFCHSFAGVFLKTELCGHAGVWFTTFHNRGQCPVHLLYSDLKKLFCFCWDDSHVWKEIKLLFYTCRVPWQQKETDNYNYCLIRYIERQSKWSQKKESSSDWSCLSKCSFGSTTDGCSNNVSTTVLFSTIKGGRWRRKDSYQEMGWSFLKNTTSWKTV